MSHFSAPVRNTDLIARFNMAIVCDDFAVSTVR
ncbi:MAG: hypothetical protein QOF94_1438 [Acidobacteriaceae bacterium]|jgi:hypothetical protein